MAGIDAGTFLTAIQTQLYVKKAVAIAADTGIPTAAELFGNDLIVESDAALTNKIRKVSSISGLGTTGSTNTFEYFDQEEADSEAGSPTREDFSFTFADRYEAAEDPQGVVLGLSIGDEVHFVLRERQAATKSRLSHFKAKLLSLSQTTETGGARNSWTATFARQTVITRVDQPN